MKRVLKQIGALALAVMLIGVLLPDSVFAGTSTTTTVENSSGMDYEKTIYSESTSVTVKNEDADEAAEDEVVLVSTTTKYTLRFTVWTQATSSKDDSLRFVKISKPKLITKVTKKYSDGTKNVTTKTKTYSVTLKVYAGSSWYKAQKNDAGTGYKYKASSGSYIKAVIVKPSDSLKKAMKTAGLTFYYQAEMEYWGTLGWAKAGLTSGTTGNSCAMTGLNFNIVTTADAKELDTTNRYIAKAAVQYKTRSTGSSSYSSSVKNGSTSGTKSASASIDGLAVKTIKSDTGYSISGGIKYSVRTTFSDASANWSDYVSNYSKAGTSGDGIQAIKIKLTGDMADYYDVYYRVYVGNYGWLDWAKNGQKAGTKRIGLTIGAVQIKIVPKGADAPGDTDDHFIDSISGDDTLDGYLQTIYKKKGTNLKTLYKYVASFTYYRTYDTPSGSWKKWTITYAKEFWENKGGNCYRYASLLCWLAIGLGYNAKVVTGYVPSRSQGWAPHGWVEVTKSNGSKVLIDPDLYKSYPQYNWYMVSYSSAPVTYKKSS